MKVFKITPFLFLVAVGLPFLPQENVPKKVKKAFAVKFPKVKVLSWENEGNGQWEADFKRTKTKYSALFSEDGIWLKTEHEISESEVPAKVLAALKEAFPDYEVDESEKLETNGGPGYEFEMEKGNEEIEVTTDENGKIIKKKTDEDDAEDDD